MRDERLVQQVGGQQPTELAHQVGVPAEFQLAADPLEDGSAALLVQRVPHLRRPVAADPGQRLAAPQPVRLPQQPGGVLVVAGGGEAGGLAAHPAELVKVDGLGVDVE